jgi:hypothetical protein
MSTLIKQADIRTIAMGVAVTRAAAVVPTVAQSPQSVFTVAGGRIVITAFVGAVTTVMDATAYTITIGLTPTVGTAAAAALASGTALASKEVGTLVGLGAAVGGAMVVGTNASTPVLIAAPRQVIEPGTITLTGSATQTGAMSWTLVYVALDTGVTVAAA